MLLLILGLMLITLGLALVLWPRKILKKNSPPDRAGGDKIMGVAVIMIGTIPIIIGSDPKTVMILMLLDLFMMIIWVLTTKRSLENETHRNRPPGSGLDQIAARMDK